MMETDKDNSINPEIDDVNKLGNPTPTLPPYDPAQSEDGLCDLTTKKPDTPVGSAQLSTTGRLAPDRRDLWTEKSDQTEPGTTQRAGKCLETVLLLTILVFNLWLCIFLIFLTKNGIFLLREKRAEEQGSKGQE